MKFILTFFSCVWSCTSNAQQINTVDFKSISAKLSFKPDSSQVNGLATVAFKILKPTDSIVIDAKKMKIIGLSDLKRKVNFDYNGKQIVYKSKFKVGETYHLEIYYTAQPKKALYFIDWNKDMKHPEYNPQIWTQGQGKYTSNWLPSIDDMNDKILFDFSITFDDEFEVIANGMLTNRFINTDNIVWKYQMKQPMSSYLVALSIGKYSVYKETSKSGIPLEMFYYPKDSLKVESTYRYSKQMFDFLEAEIGVPYPWKNYKQVPVKDFLYSGMENTSCTIFSDAFVVDDIQFNDKNYVNVNAHELAHQWFGDLVTETEGKHHWLQEGFATYYALLAEKSVFGEAYYFETLYDYALELKAQNDAGQTSVVMSPKASSATFYKKGAIVLHLLREKVGDKTFKLAVKNYLEAFQFKNVETKNFIAEVEATSEENLTQFVDLWLKDGTFHFNLVEESLLKSDFYQEYNVSDCEAMTSKCKDWLKAPISDRAKAKLIQQQPQLINKNTFKNPLKVRQAISGTLQTIPTNLQLEFESLLEDDSYQTQEVALYKLWANFPEKRPIYLDKMALVTGDNTKNIKLLWLALALNTENYKVEEKQAIYEELVNYTNPVYNFNIRQVAFTYLRDMNAFNAIALKHLEIASKHHNWRFRSFCSKLLKQLKKVD